MSFEAAGYSLVLPPGWVRVPVHGDVDKTLDAAIDRALPADLPRDEATPLKVKIKGRLLKAAAESRDIGALDLYLPLEGMHGLAIPASFIVSDIPVPPGQDEAAAVRDLVRTGAEPVTVEGDDALRLDETVQPDSLMSEDVRTPSRRITYLIPAPGVPHWVSVTFSTVGDGDPASEFTEVLIGLFDAIMTTFRWTEAAASTP
jgi:hypothetical protein